MKTFTKLKLTAAIVPVLALGMGGSAFAGAHDDEGPDHGAMNGPEAGMDEPAARAADHASAPHFDRAPEGAQHAGDIIGANIYSRSDDTDLGEVRDLVIDRDGNIVAVIVGTGGVLGLGEKDIALSWDRVSHEMDGDDIKLYVDMDEETLQDAPEYERN